MSTLKESEKNNFISLLNRCESSGYNLGGLSNQRFREFVYSSIKIDVYSDIYASYPSKNKKLVFLMDTLDNKIIGKLLLELLQHTVDSLYINSSNKELFDKCVNVANRLIEKNATIPKIKEIEIVNHNVFDYQKHLDDIMALVKTEETVQKRGFIFQDFLNSFFEDCGFKPKKSFKVNGNQIDGSIEVDHEIYLVEAKWQQLPSGIAELEKFETVVSKQSGITRGVFISFSGFVESSIKEFRVGTKPRFFLITGLDIILSLQHKDNFHEIFKQKLRALAEGKMLIMSNSI